MLKLPQVTLVAITGDNYRQQEHLDMLKKSSEKIQFGAVKLVQIKNIVDIGTWNSAVIYDLPKAVDTSHCLLMHEDAEIIHPELWNNKWLKLDFIGSPWPLPTDDFSYKDEAGDIQRVGNSVSLRSKKLLDLIATRPWKSYYGNCNEDGFICCHNRKWLESQGCKFATFEQALKFGKENELPENKDLETFLIHKI